MLGLHDWEMEELFSLLDTLVPVPLSGNEDTRLLDGDVSGVFSCKSFLIFLSLPSGYPSFPIANFLGKSKALLKVRAFVWTFGKIDTNYMRQRRRPGVAISPDICVMCWQ